MRIVSPGTALREAPDDVRRRRAAGLTAAVIVAGWALTMLCAATLGTQAGRNAWLLGAIGIVTGITWATKRWDAQRDTSLQVLLVAATLQATAASLAFDRGVVAAWGFALLVAIAAGQVGRSRRQVAAQTALLAACELLAAAFGPDRAPHAPAIALAGTLLLAVLAAASTALRERAQRAARRTAGGEPGAGDAGRLHDSLVAAVAADPKRFALLTMDLHGIGPDRVADIGRLLGEQVRGHDVVERSDDARFSILAADMDGAGAAALARRIEQAVAEAQRAEVGALNAAIGIAVYPDDGRTPDELLARAGAALAEIRAERPRVRIASASR